MSEKDLKRRVSELEKSLKGEKDLNKVLEIWGKLENLAKQKEKLRGCSENGRNC
ncbi:hypothetical protein IJE86_07870 [bacterium]|nr:hypothetical protein [bacterium]